eukprot:TRINITY_DN74256_c0_g1_i1.p1 TRINITY_DN74256_c0_g1~~TRINITY_DN74256_c0_g1_i1.p1  ORF type:complete len:474 (-),score=53.74 TRINITY_DN74256_c0_g1_i1:66-1487(-)
MLSPTWLSPWNGKLVRSRSAGDILDSSTPRHSRSLDERSNDSRARTVRSSRLLSWNGFWKFFRRSGRPSPDAAVTKDPPKPLDTTVIVASSPVNDAVMQELELLRMRQEDTWKPSTVSLEEKQQIPSRARSLPSAPKPSPAPEHLPSPSARLLKQSLSPVPARELSLNEHLRDSKSYEQSSSHRPDSADASTTDQFRTLSVQEQLRLAVEAADAAARGAVNRQETPSLVSPGYSVGQPSSGSEASPWPPMRRRASSRGSQKRARTADARLREAQELLSEMMEPGKTARASESAPSTPRARSAPRWRARSKDSRGIRPKDSSGDNTESSQLVRHAKTEVASRGTETSGQTLFVPLNFPSRHRAAGVLSPLQSLQQSRQSQLVNSPNGSSQTGSAAEGPPEVQCRTPRARASTEGSGYASSTFPLMAPARGRGLKEASAKSPYSDAVAPSVSRIVVNAKAIKVAKRSRRVPMDTE